MEKINSLKFLLSFLAFLTTVTLTAQLKQIPLDSIAISIKQNTETFAFRTYNSCQSNQLPKLNNKNATQNFIEKYKSEKVFLNCTEINKKSGKLKKLHLQEVLKDSASNYIFRFKAFYEKTEEVREIRVYTNSEFKFDGIIHNPWYYNKYYKFGEKAIFYKLNLDTLNKKYIANAYEFADKTFRNCQEGNFLKLTQENATKRLENSLTTEKLVKACNEVYSKFGNLISLDLFEVLSDGYRIIYRYKAKYKKVANFREIVIMTNLEHKFGAIYINDNWNDTFKEEEKK